MNITPDQARELLDGATPGPWSSHHDEWEDENGIECEDFYVIGGTDGILSTENFDPDNHDPVANTTLAAAAPDLAQTIAGMRTEWGVEQATGTTQWFRSRPMAEAHAEVRGAFRLVRRLVGPVEVTE